MDSKNKEIMKKFAKKILSSPSHIIWKEKKFEINIWWLFTVTILILWRKAWVYALVFRALITRRSTFVWRFFIFACLSLPWIRTSSSSVTIFTIFSSSASAITSFASSFTCLLSTITSSFSTITSSALCIFASTKKVRNFVK